MKRQITRRTALALGGLSVAGSAAAATGLTSAPTVLTLPNHPPGWNPEKDASSVCKVESQGRRGTCQAFAVTALFRANAILHYGADHSFNISEQWLVARNWHVSKEIPGMPDQGRLAASTATFIDDLIKRGSVVRDNGSYRPLASDEQLKDINWEEMPNPVKSVEVLRVNRHFARDREATINAITQCLHSGYPCALGIWSDNMNGGQSLISNVSRGGGHAVLFVGWSDGVHGTNDRVFKFLNSWGPGWGWGGFGYMTLTALRERIMFHGGHNAFIAAHKVPALRSGLKKQDFSGYTYTTTGGTTHGSWKEDLKQYGL